MAPRTATRPPRLRLSCDACVDSKVGCGREKPACSRCVKRNRPCTYSAARRPGRTSKPKIPTAMMVETPNSTASSSSSDSPKLATKCESDANVSPRTTHAQTYQKPLPQPSSHWNPAFMDTFGSPADPSLAFPLQPTLDPNVDGLFGDTVVLSNDDLFALGCQDLSCSDFDMFGTVRTIESDIPDNSITTASPFSDESFSSGSTGSFTPTDGSTPQSSSHRTESIATMSPSSMMTRYNKDMAWTSNPSQVTQSCPCLSQAISLCARLMDPILSPSDLNTTMAITAEATNQITRILQCHSCQNDTYTLVLTSLALLRVIALYTDAAQTASRAAYERRESTCKSTGSSNQDPIEFEHILCKLAGVQALNQRLSRRLDSMCGDGDRHDFQPMSIGSEGSSSSVKHRPLSTELANLVVAGLPQRLCDSSCAIAERMRHN